MKRYLISLSLCIVSIALYAPPEPKKAPLRTLQEKNKAADKAFITWRLNARGSTVSTDLRTLLTEEPINYLVEESQLPFTKYMSNKELKTKVRAVMGEFRKKYNHKDVMKTKQWELEELITEIIMPEYQFQVNPNTFDSVDKTYNELLEGLSHYRTKAGTFLHMWALRFLTSESQLVALSVIERETKDGKPYNELSDSEKGRILTSAGDLITQRFMNNLEPDRSKFGFRVPPHATMAVKKRVDLFLREKFGL